MASQIRQNYHEDCEALINKQINMELYASYVYLSMSSYFDRDDVALPGVQKFFTKASSEERDHAMKFMKYQSSRGGKVVLQAIEAPAMQEWGNALNSLEAALTLEKEVNQSLLDLHGKASSRNDPHLSKFLEDEFLDEQVEAIKELGDYISQLKRAGPSGFGEYVFDRDLASKE
ncbi:UNVERIFIED_CONTAM: hypothetical protein GTU68_066698 [Idotea baltica]|nr:hypothetical protein [Idotea baltica]